MGERDFSRHTRNVFETLQMLVKRAESADLQARRGADPSATLEQIKQRLTQVQNEIDTALQSIREQQEEAKQREQTKPDILKQMDVLRQRHFTEQIPQLPLLIQDFLHNPALINEPKLEEQLEHELANLTLDQQLTLGYIMSPNSYQTPIINAYTVAQYLRSKIQERPPSPPRAIVPTPRPVSPPRAVVRTPSPPPRVVIPAPRAPSPPRGNLQAMTVTQLRDLARQRNIKGYSTKRKDELIAMLQ